MVAGDITAKRAKSSDFPCAVFDGVDDVVAFSPVINVNNSYTLSSWIYTGDNGRNSIFGDSSISSGFLFIRDFTKTVDFEPINDGLGCAISFSSYGSILNKWVYITVVVENSNNLKLYLDGNYIGNSSPANNDTNFNIEYIGRGYTGVASSFFNGSIRDVRIYDTALTAEEVSLLYNGTNIKTGLVARYKLADDYNDSAGTNNGTNTGSYLTNTIQNKLKADANSLNLAKATDKIIALPIIGRDGNFTILGANRE